MRHSPAALLLVLALGLTACTDEDDPSDSSSSSPSTSDSVAPTETGESDKQPAADVCKVLDVEAVGKILGAPVERVIEKKGCRFGSLDDPDAASLGISQDELVKLGGIDGSKAGIGSVVEGEVEDVPGVGDAAFVVVGPTFGGSTPTGGGAVALGSSLVQVTVIPSPGATDEDVRAVTVDVLTLIAEKAG
jgi:hypothetical protein